jgi:DNA (cytosine-5)-methyltransferase 1
MVDAMKWASVCTGIHAPGVAWAGLGWDDRWGAEIDPFCRALLAARYPETRVYDDFTKIENPEAVDLVVAGTPCQSFSIAGGRAGLDDARGNLAVEYFKLAHRVGARWVVWENVPGVLSSDGGKDFAAILRVVEECGYGWAYRILDAQHFGVPQRRRRVFLVGHSGDWRRAAAVLFERESLRGDIAPGGEAGEGVAALTANGVGTCGADDNQGQAGHLIATLAGSGGGMERPGGLKNEADFLITHTPRADGFDASEDGTGRGTPLVSFALNGKGGSGRLDGESETLIAAPLTANAYADQVAEEGKLVVFQGKASASNSMNPGELAPVVNRNNADGLCVAIAQNQPGEVRIGEVANTLNTNFNASGRNTAMMMQGMAVRRLTPRECERLQGFPDDYTLIDYRGKAAADGPRYRALGNSMAVPVVKWIGERIALVEGLR